MKNFTLSKFETCSRINNLEGNSFHTHTRQKVRNISRVPTNQLGKAIKKGPRIRMSNSHNIEMATSIWKMVSLTIMNKCKFKTGDTLWPQDWQKQKDITLFVGEGNVI